MENDRTDEGLDGAMADAAKSLEGLWGQLRAAIKDGDAQHANQIREKMQGPLRLIALAPAHGLPGVLVKLRQLVGSITISSVGFDEPLIRTAIEAVERLSTERKQ